MDKFIKFISDIQHASVFIIAVIEIVFLIILLLVFKYNYPDVLRTVLKDAFLGWNTALALCLNIGKREDKSDGSANKD